ncbi:MAG: hypothetical protein FJX94_03215 [Bacteroidetes bacterium]|nr:hypothetical protein [Bacteroidota bacterium]
MRYTFLFILFFSVTSGFAQDDAMRLLQKVKAKMDRVNDYAATGKMRTDVVFIKAPVSNIRVYYKKPNRFKINRDGGISLLPKGGVSVNLNALMLTNDFTALDAGKATIAGKELRVIKLLPLQENSDVVLSTMYIDELRLLVLKTNTTTRENGTYEMEMQFGNYADYGLPDKVTFTFNTKDYKLPKGITLEFDDGSKQQQLPKNKKGRIEISYASYQVNKGVSDAMFK